MPDKALDPVEWELVRADIAMEKARLKANGDWSCVSACKIDPLRGVIGVQN